MTKEELLKEVHFDEKGLVSVICQDYHSKKIRMLAYMNEEALLKTLETKEVYYYSRSRQKLWHKGEESGHFQYLKGMSIDCDGDALLIQVEQKGGISCHTGNATCFYRDLTEDVSMVLNRRKKEISHDALDNLYETIVSRKMEPIEGSYTNYLLDKGDNKILKKIGEETTEVIIACKENKRQDIIYEIADLMYHLSVEMVEKDIRWSDIKDELESR